MNTVGRKIFYDKSNGNIILDKGEMQGDIITETINEVIAKFTALSERNRDTFDVLELPFGAYQQDFAESNGYRVNVVTKELEFSYPDPNAPTEPPVYQKALSEQILELQARQDTTEPYVERVKTATEIYEENKDKTDLLLEDVKQLRINKLKEECSNSIYEGFELNGAHFGFNVHDQSNFTQQLLLIVAGNTAPIQWKTKNVGVLELTVPQFQAVIGKATNHKMTEQAKYWTIEQSIIAAQTKEEVTIIEW